MYKYVGSRVFYLKETGEIVFITGQRKGGVIPTTPEQDLEIYEELHKYNKDSLKSIQLRYDEYKTEFEEATSYCVDIEAGVIVFDYSQKPEKPDIPVEPTLREKVDAQQKEIDQLKVENEALKTALDDIMMMSL